MTKSRVGVELLAHGRRRLSARVGLLALAFAMFAGCLPRGGDCYADQAIGDIVEIEFIEVLDVPDIADLPSCGGLDGLSAGTYRFQLVWRGFWTSCVVYGARPLDPIGDLSSPPSVVYPIGGPFSAAIPYCDGYWKLLSGHDGPELRYDVPYVPGEPPPITMRRSIEGYECDGGPPRYCADTWAAEVHLVSRGDGDGGPGDGGPR